MNESPNPPQQQRHVWPWFVLALFLLGVVLAVAWVRAEMKRTKERTDPTWPPQSSVSH